MSHPNCVSVFKLKQIQVFFFIVSICLFGQIAQANTDTGIAWLQGQNATDGSIAQGSDKANAYQATSETLATYNLFSVTPNAQSNNALAYLNSFDAQKLGAEYLSRRIILNAKAGQATATDVAELLTRKNRDGGFGQYAGFDSEALSSSFAIQALSAANEDELDNALLSFLTNSQNTDGSWSLGDNTNNVQITAYAMQALQVYSSRFSLTTELDKAKDYLEQIKGSNILWDDLEESALALNALLSYALDKTPYQVNVDALIAQQQSNGSFANDVYLTALSLQAVNALTTPNPRSISVEGVVIDADARQALQNVTIQLVGLSTYDASTDANGSFSFDNIDAGSYELRISQQGFSDLTSNLNLNTGDQIDLGSLVLTPVVDNPTTGNLLGTVTDVAGQPLANVTVSIRGTTQSVQTNAQGQYQISGITPGTISIDVSLDGLAPVNAISSIIAGQTLAFSPSLEPLANVVARAEGIVTDQETGSAIVGAIVAVNNGDQVLSATTGSNGEYVIEGILPGNITLTASSTGYQSQTGSTTVNNSANINFSPALALEGTVVTEPNNGSIIGVVVDRQTGDVISGATVSVTINGNVQTTTSNAGGEFTVTNLSSGSANVEVSATTYQATSLITSLPASTRLDIGQLRLLSETATGVYQLQGKVVDAVTNEPLAGVSVRVLNSDILNDPNPVILTTNAQGEYSLADAPRSVAIFYALDEYFTRSYGTVFTQEGLNTIDDIRLRSQEVVNFVPDLKVTSVNSSNVVTDPQSLETTGSISFDLINQGNTPVTEPFAAIAFYDENKNGQYDAGVDVQLGSLSIEEQSEVDEPKEYSIILVGSLPFRDAPIQVFVDSGQVVVESNEENNLFSSANECQVSSNCLNPDQIGTFEPTTKWQWSGGEVTHTPVIGPFIDTNEDGLVDQNDTPMVIAIAGKTLYALNGDTGEVALSQSTSILRNEWSGPALADINADGKTEIIAYANDTSIVAIDNQGVELWRSEPIISEIPTFISIADIDADGQAEILAGEYILNSDGTTKWVGNPNPSNSSSTIAVDLDLDGVQEVIINNRVYRANGDLYWERLASRRGLLAIGNLDDDEFPEIVVTNVSSFSIVEHDGTLKLGPINLGARGNGGAPTIGDLDGDGQPEIGIVGRSSYIVYDLNGQLKWFVDNDDSSSLTTSSFFDFDLDGYPEVVFASQALLRVFDGRDGSVKFSEPHFSRTFNEGPAIADVNGDGHANIIVSNSSGIKVLQNTDNSWPRTRKIWNEHTYNISNVNDDGSIPQTPERPWLTHNTYRVNSITSELCVDEQEPIPLNLTNWEEFAVIRAGTLQPTDWDLIDQNTAEFRHNAQPVFLVSDFDFADGKIRGTFQTNDRDDDWMGFLWGYQNDRQFYRFLWDEGNCGCMAVEVVDSPTPLIELDDTGITTLAQSDIVWERGVEYRYELTFEPGRSQIEIYSGSELIEEFVILDDTYSSGKFAFYNHSQPQTTYTAALYPTDERTDLSVSKLEFNESQAAVSARFGNGGQLLSPAEAKANVYRIPVDGGEKALLGTIDLPALASGEFADLSLANLTGLQAGDTIEVIVDEERQISECREDNNSLSIVLAGLEGQVVSTLSTNTLTSGSDLVVTRVVTNSGTLASNYSITTSVTDSNGNVIVAFDAQDITNVLPSESNSSGVTWNSGNLLSGSYIAKTVLFDRQGTQIDESNVTFTITTDATVSRSVTLRVTPDKPTYYITDSVEILDLIQNVSTNDLIPSASLVVEVLNPSGEVVFTDTQALSDLSPSSSREIYDAYSFTQVPEGDYLINAKVLDANGGILAEASNSFSVQNNLFLSLSGQVTALEDSVVAGEPQQCTHVVTNNGTQSVTDQAFRHVLISFDQEQEISTSEFTLSIASGQSGQFEQSFETTGFTPGSHACVLQANINGAWQTLANAPFDVLEAPIAMTLSSVIGEKGRVLVLVDDEDPVPATSTPTVAEQRSYLETLLTNAGWLYTITSEGSDFVTELQTGSYSNYVLLSSLESISEQGQEELRKAVSEGAGFIEAGNPSQRQSGIDALLGVQFQEDSNNVQGISVQDSDLQSEINVTLSAPKEVLIAQLDGAISVAFYVPDFAQSGQAPPPAITLHTVGEGEVKGKSIFIGFDLLEEASIASGVDNDYATLLLNALTYVTPEPVLNFPESAIPVVLSIGNQGKSTPSRLSLVLPEGVEYIGASPAEDIIYDVATRTITSNRDLVQAESVDLTLWFSAQATTTVSAILESGEEPDFVEQATTSIELVIQERQNEEVVDSLGIASSFNAFILQDFESTASDSHGKIAAGGNVTLDSYGLASRLPSQPETPTLVVGGDLSYGQGKIFVGGALVGGSTANVNPTVVYGLENGASIEENATIPIDFESEFVKLRQLSTNLAAVEPTATIEYKYGGVYITGDCSSETQVINLNGTTVLNSNHMVLNCVPSTSTIVFNIDGQTAGFKNIGLSQLHNQAPKIVYNFHEATTVQFTWVGVEGTVLAPNAHLDNPRGQVNGSVIAKSWNGPMELHDFQFTGSFEPVLNTSNAQAQ